MRIQGYNTQRDNQNWKGKFPSWVQCFATSAWMWLCYYSNGFFKIDDDDGLSGYLYAVITGSMGGDLRELSVDEFKKEFYWENHFRMLQKYLSTVPDFKGTVKYSGDSGMSFEEFSSQLQNGPVIVGTNRIGGLPGGHIIIADSVDENGSVIVKDPYGDATTGYKSGSGDGAVYPGKLLFDHTGNGYGEGLHFIWME